MVLLLFMGGFDPCLILPMELKNRGLMGINPSCWKHSSGIAAEFYWKIPN
jgi:hypothetical protein